MKYGSDTESLMRKKIKRFQVEETGRRGSLLSYSFAGSS